MANFSPISVKVSFNDDTLDSLYHGGYSLLMFKGLNGPPDLVSTVWHSQASMGTTNVISWQSRHHNAYVSNSALHGVVDVVNEKVMKAGQMATVQPSNRLDIGPGTPGYYQISNFTDKSMLCGLTAINGKGNSAPICATTLYGNFTCGMEPVEKVYLCFSNERTLVGTVWTETTSSGYVIDVTDPTMNGITVNYDINSGWSCSDHVQVLNCTEIPVATSFASFLNSVSA